MPTFEGTPWIQPYTAQQIQDARANQVPKVGANGNWWVWDINKSDFVDTGTPARGPQGIQGDNGKDGATGPQGIQGVKGDTGPYAFEVNSNSHLILHYVDDTTPPDFQIDSRGHLILTF